MSTIERLAKIKNLDALLENQAVIDAVVSGPLGFVHGLTTVANILEGMDAEPPADQPRID